MLLKEHALLVAYIECLILSWDLLFKALAKEVGKHNINVNCVAVGATAHEGTIPRLDPDDTPETSERLSKMLKNYPIGSCGIAEAALEAAIDYAKKRKQFGKIIGQFQMVQQLIAEMIIEVDAGKLLAFKAYKLLENGKPCRAESSIAKAFCTEMAVRVTSKAMQVFGSYGLSTEYPLERYFRDARVYTFPDGTTQIQQLIIAREALGISAIR